MCRFSNAARLEKEKSLIIFSDSNVVYLIHEGVGGVWVDLLPSLMAEEFANEHGQAT